jgi:hypothetical protein
LKTVQLLLDAKQISEALAIAAPNRQLHPLLENAVGVCLLRAGDLAGALAIFRALADASERRGTRAELPVAISANLATTLLLAGDMAGTVHVLHELHGTGHAAVGRLWKAIYAWEAGMTASQAKLWRFFEISPKRPVVLAFPPGDLF